MKHLNEYINESIIKEIDFNVNEAKSKWFRFNLDNFDQGYDAVKTIADRNKLYNEPIDGGIKIEAKPGQEHKLTAIIELFTDYVNSKQDDDKCKETCERITGYIDSMQEFIEDKDAEAEEEAKSKETEEGE
jgi:hypothetical protein